MQLLFANNATTQIAGSITSSDTTVTLIAGTGAEFPAPVAGTSYFVATLYDQLTMTQNEIVWVTARTGDTLTIMRAQEGTVAQDWTSGDIFSNLLTSGQMNSFVQKGSGIPYIPDTSILYLGVDQGVANAIIVPVMVPPLPGIALGTTFVIKVNVTNTGATVITTQGAGPYPVVRTNGAPLVAGDLTGGETMLMTFDGAKFVTTVQDIVVKPPSTSFYVAPGGDDNNSGLDPSHAFKTSQGAVNTLINRFTAPTGVSLYFAAGTYLGVAVPASSIASFAFIGDPAAPGNVIFDATSLAQGNGRAITIGSGAQASASGITFHSYLENVAINGTMTLSKCGLTRPANAATSGVVMAYNGLCQLRDQLTYTDAGGTPVVTLFGSDNNGLMLFGYKDAVVSNPLNVQCIGAPIFSSGYVVAASLGAVAVYEDVCTFTGVVPTGPHFAVSANGVIAGEAPLSLTLFPGTTAGIKVTGGQYI